MCYDEIVRNLDRLKFEDFLWIFYGSIIIANLFGNYYEKQFLKTQYNAYEIRYNTIFEVIFILTFFIYVYLFVRNYNSYQEALEEDRSIYLVRVFGSVFFITGILCFIYYQDAKRRKAYRL